MLVFARVLQSIGLLSDGCNSFQKNCVMGIQANENRLHSNVVNYIASEFADEMSETE